MANEMCRGDFLFHHVDNSAKEIAAGLWGDDPVNPSVAPTFRACCRNHGHHHCDSEGDEMVAILLFAVHQRSHVGHSLASAALQSLVHCGHGCTADSIAPGEVLHGEMCWYDDSDHFAHQWP